MRTVNSSDSGHLCAALLATSLLVATSGRADAEVLMTEKAALARAFPGAIPERRTLYLTPEQVAAVEKAARSKLPSAVVTTFAAPAGLR